MSCSLLLLICSSRAFLFSFSNAAPLSSGSTSRKAVQGDEDETFLKFVRELPIEAQKYETEVAIEKTATTLSENVFSAREDEEKYALLNEFTFHAHLGVLHLMKMHWHCDKTPSQFETQCSKYGAYMEILYEYLYQVYYQANHGGEKLSELAPQKPKFRFDKGKNSSKVFKTLTDAVFSLNYIARFLFLPKCREIFSNDFEQLVNASFEPFLENWDDLVPKYFYYGQKMIEAANTEKTVLKFVAINLNKLTQQLAIAKEAVVPTKSANEKGQNATDKVPQNGHKSIGTVLEGMEHTVNSMKEVMQSSDKARADFAHAMARMAKIAEKIDEMVEQKSDYYKIKSGIWVTVLSPFLLLE